MDEAVQQANATRDALMAPLLEALPALDSLQAAPDAGPCPVGNPRFIQAVVWESPNPATLRMTTFDELSAVEQTVALGRLTWEAWVWSHGEGRFVCYGQGSSTNRDEVTTSNRARDIDSLQVDLNRQALQDARGSLRALPAG